MTNRQKVRELNIMLNKYLDAEVIVMTKEEACPYEYASQMSSIGDFRHDYYYLPNGNEWGLDEERIYFKSDGDLEDEIYGWIEDEGQIPKVLGEELIDKIPWNECIVMYVDAF